MIPRFAKFLFLFFISFSILLATAEAREVADEVLENPAGVDELTVRFTQYGRVDMEGKATAITINFSIPQDDWRQDVDIGVDKVKDVLGNYIGVVEEENPDNNFSYTFSGTIKSRANHLLSLPSSYVIPDEAEVYLKSTGNIQSSDPRFSELAGEIAGNSRDDFEKVAKIAMWVNEHLDYDLSYSDRNIDALTVLETKVGVCAEYTTLFIALVRSIGIPAKFVSGWSYGERGWERHAYSEVYLGEWVPVDPLWMEIGYMDAAHLKFGDHDDNYVRNNLEISGYGVKNIEWHEDDVELEIVSYSQAEKMGDYDLTISSDEFIKGDYGIVVLSIVPSEFIVGKITLQPCTGENEPVEVDQKGKNVILRPGEREQVYWKIRINPDLPKNYIFTCPLTLNSRSLAMKKVDAVVNTRYVEREHGKLSASLSSKVLQLGEEQTVYINADLNGPNAWVGVIAEHDHERYEGLSGDFLTTFTFTPGNLGKGSIQVYTSEGDVLTLEYDVQSTLSIGIEDFQVPRYLKVGDRKNVTAQIVNNGNSDDNVRLNINVDGEDNLATFLLKNKYAVSLPVSFPDPGAKKITIEVTGTNTHLSETRVIEVYEEPVVHYDTDYSDGKAILRLDVQKSKITNVTIKLGGEERTAKEIYGKKDIEFSLAPGEYVMTLSCADIAGKPYEISGTIEFRELNFLEQILAAINNFIDQLMGFFSSE